MHFLTKNQMGLIEVYQVRFTSHGGSEENHTVKNEK